MLEKFLLITGFSTVTGVVALIGSHAHYEANLSSLLEQTTTDASREISPVSNDELDTAITARKKYLSDIANQGVLDTSRSLDVRFDPEQVIKLSSAPEILEASRILNQARSHRDKVDELKRERGLATRETVYTAINVGGGSVALISGALFLAGSVDELSNRRARRKAMFGNHRLGGSS